MWITWFLLSSLCRFNSHNNAQSYCEFALVCTTTCTDKLHLFFFTFLCIFAENGDIKHPKITADGIQKKSNKTQYLYQQLCHIDKELSLLGPSGFPTSHSYNQALHQVQGMKGFLEDQLFTSSSTNFDEPTQKQYRFINLMHALT